MSTSAGVPQAKTRRKLFLLNIGLAIAVVVLVLQLLTVAMKGWMNRPRAGHQTWAEARLRTGYVQYVVYLPQSYSSEKRWPLLLFLHGSGQRGDDVRQVLKYGIPALIAQGRHLPMIVVSPQCPANTTWHSQQLLELLDSVEASFAVDASRTYIAGFSMGGTGAWELAAAAPERFAAVVPVCGGGSVRDAHRLVGLPIWAFHGAQDSVVPLQESKRMVDSISKAGGNARLTVLERHGHGINDIVFSREDLCEWLLRQQKAEGEKGDAIRQAAGAFP